MQAGACCVCSSGPALVAAANALLHCHSSQPACKTRFTSCNAIHFPVGHPFIALTIASTASRCWLHLQRWPYSHCSCPSIPMLLLIISLCRQCKQVLTASAVVMPFSQLPSPCSAVAHLILQAVQAGAGCVCSSCPALHAAAARG